MDELAEHGGQPGPPRKYGGLGGEPLGGPESAGGPVSEGPGDAQLPHQRKYVVVLRSTSHSYDFLRMPSSCSGHSASSVSGCAETAHVRVQTS